MSLIAVSAVTLAFAVNSGSSLTVNRPFEVYLSLASMTSMMCAMLLTTRAVWMPPDDGFVCLWSGGMVASLYAAQIGWRPQTGVAKKDAQVPMIRIDETNLELGK